MYLIADKELSICGLLSLEGKGCRFYQDARNVQISDDTGKLWNDTLEIYVPYGYPQTVFMQEGYHLIKQGDDGYWYCFRINKWTDSVIGPVHVKHVLAVNLCIWDLAHTQVVPATLKNATSTEAFEHNLMRSGWQIGVDNFGSGGHDITFNLGENEQQKLDELTSTYSIEIRAYVQIYNGKVVNKLIDLETRLGEPTGRRLEYARNLLGIERTGGDDQLFTKLYIYGGTPDGQDSPVSIAQVNNGADFLIDDDANDLYNGGGKYLEGFTQNTSILNTSGLLDWGKEQLALYNHPRYTYTVDVAQIDWVPNLGDSLDVVDFEMDPELTVNARVIQKTESEANPENNKVVIGEFIEIQVVTPSDIWRLQAAASQAQQTAEKALSYRVEQFIPNGLDFSSQDEKKQIIIRVFLGTENVTSQIDQSRFIWEKVDADGSHDIAWEEEHEGVGNVIEVGYEVSGSTIRCHIDDGDNSSAIFADETNASFFATLATMDENGFSQNVAQYAQVDEPRSQIFWSQRYYGSYIPDGEDSEVYQSYTITRTDMSGTPIDMMYCIHGGHGAQFGIEYLNGKTYIYSYYLDKPGAKWCVVRFPYKAGKVLDFGDASIEVLTMTGAFGTGSWRTNLDIKNQLVLFAVGNTNAKFYVCKKSDLLNNSFKPLYTMSVTDVGFNKDQTFQSSCLDFPYVYFTSGNADNSDQRVMYCCDVRSRSLVYKIVYTFDKGTINPPTGDMGTYREPECISYYYDSTGKKWLIQGFAFSNDDTASIHKINQLYRIEEQKKG